MGVEEQPLTTVVASTGLSGDSGLLSLLLFSELERLSNLVGKPSENHPLHNSGLLSLDPVQDKTPLYSQLLQAYKWSNKVRRRMWGEPGFSGS